MNVAIVNCFDTYEHRVDLLYDFFRKQRNNVRIYTSNFRHIEKVKRTDKKKDYIYIDSLEYKKNISPGRLYSHHQTAKDLFKRLSGQKIDLLWVLVPPNSFVKEAAKYKIAHEDTKLVFDIIDMWPETMPLERFKKIPLVKMWRLLRDNWIKYADHVVTECDLFQEKLADVIDPGMMSTIYLAREIKPYNAKPEPPEDKISLCYLGSINNIIDIPAIVEIVKRSRAYKPVVLHIIGDGETRQQLIDDVSAAGAEVIYHGKIYDPDEKQRIFDSCHYGLNVMKDTVYVGLTMKSIDYFEAGLPIINNIHGDTWDIINEKDLGINFDQSFDSRLRAMDLAEARGKVRAFFESELSVESFENNIRKILEKI